jgi:hypothetical protein
MANQGTGLLFIGAEILANLACCSCSIPWIKPLQAIAIVEEGSLIFNIAIDCKVQFSLKIQRKSNLKTPSANCFQPRRQSTLMRDIARAPRQPVVRAPRAHAEAPEDPSVHAPRRSATVRDVRERLDGARWLLPTRRRANRRSPLGRRSAAYRRALLLTPRMHRRRG